MKGSNCPPLEVTLALSLNCHRSITIRLPMTVCWMFDQLSIRCCLNSSTSRKVCWQTYSCSTAKIP